MAITSNRNRYVPFHTTPDVVEAVRKVVKSTGQTRSKVIHDLLVEALRGRGHDVTGYELRIKRS